MIIFVEELPRRVRGGWTCLSLAMLTLV